MRIKCDNCGASACKPANYVRLWKNHFCSRKCYLEYRKKHEPSTTKGMKYDISHQDTLKKLAKERNKREFKPASYWKYLE